MLLVPLLLSLELFGELLVLLVFSELLLDDPLEPGELLVLAPLLPGL